VYLWRGRSDELPIGDVWVGTRLRRCHRFDSRGNKQRSEWIEQIFVCLYPPLLQIDCGCVLRKRKVKTRQIDFFSKKNSALLHIKSTTTRVHVQQEGWLSPTKRTSAAKINYYYRLWRLYDFLLVRHCNYSSILYYLRVIWRWIISWPWKLDYRSLKVIETDAIQKLGCSFLFAFHSNYGRICSHFGDIQRQKMAWPWNLGMGSFKVIEKGAVR